MAKPHQRRDSPHARVYHHMLDSPAWHVLPAAAKLLWLDMRRQLNSFNNGDVNCAMSVLRARGWTSTSKLAKAKFALMALGFIAVTRPGGFAMGKHIPTLFRFTDLETFDIPKLRIQKCAVTNEYLSHLSHQKAREVMDKVTLELHQQACARRHRSKKTEVPNRNLPSSKSEAVQPIPRFRIGINGQSPGSKSEVGADRSNQPKKRVNQGSSVLRAPKQQKKPPSSKSEHLT
jgi:hypothetical protein